MDGTNSSASWSHLADFEDEMESYERQDDGVPAVDPYDAVDAVDEEIDADAEVAAELEDADLLV